MKFFGNINKKTINGKDYYYHQYRDNGKMNTKIIPINEAYDLALKIRLDAEDNLDSFFGHRFNVDVYFGSSLYDLEKGYRIYRRRYVYEDLIHYLEGNQTGKVFALYGLRRTGKTTLMFQSIASFSIKEYAKAAFIRIKKGDTFQGLKEDLDYLTSVGFKYIYIDEVTILDDFIALSSVLSDIHGTKSKIVLSGTDSLGIYLSTFSELFDRAILCHTTYISYKEFSEVLGIDSIDSYIEHGGTMSMEDKDYHGSSFNNDYTAYIDSAIARNITHSLKNYNDGDHFSHLYPLYEKGELVNIINRIVQDQNHRFAISAIEKDFKSNDLGSLRQLLRKNIDARISSSLDRIDEEYVIKALMEALDIINKERQSVPIDQDVLKEVEEYLDVLDVIKSVDEINIASNAVYKRKVVIQPGIRFSQAKELINILMEEESVRKLPLWIRDIIKEKLETDVKGRMLEEIALYQTSLSGNPTFKLLFPVGEFDMVVIDRGGQCSSIYEVKHSSEIDERQYAHINDVEKVKRFGDLYYPVKEKTVLYLGGDKELSNGITYRNIGEYLKAL